MIQVGDAIWQRPQWRGLAQGGSPTTHSHGPAAAPPTEHYGAPADVRTAAARQPRPAAADDVAMPPQDRSWSDDQPHRGQPVSWQHPGEQGQPRPVRPCQHRMNARTLAQCDSKLMAQHQDLSVLPPRLPPAQAQHRHGTGGNEEVTFKPTSRKSSHGRPRANPPPTATRGHWPTASSAHTPRWHRFSAPTGPHFDRARHASLRPGSTAAPIMQRMLAEEVPLDKPVWGVHNDASRGLEAGARFGVRRRMYCAEACRRAHRLWLPMPVSRAGWQLPAAAGLL